MKLSKFHLNKNREHHMTAAPDSSPEQSIVERHCPKCWKVTRHKRYVHGSIEELVCQNPKCGHTQVYTIR